MMIQMRSLLKVADNSGAKKIACIGVIGASNKRYATVGDIITASVKLAIPNAKVKKGEKVRAVVVRTVKKLNMVKRHVKPSAKYKQGGIVEKEAPLSISNVMLICDKCKVPVRVGRKVLDDGKKVRCCKKCGEVMDK